MNGQVRRKWGAPCHAAFKTCHPDAATLLALCIRHLCTEVCLCKGCAKALCTRAILALSNPCVGLCVCVPRCWGWHKMCTVHKLCTGGWHWKVQSTDAEATKQCHMGSAMSRGRIAQVPSPQCKHICSVQGAPCRAHARRVHGPLCKHMWIVQGVGPESAGGFECLCRCGLGLGR